MKNRKLIYGVDPKSFVVAGEPKTTVFQEIAKAGEKFMRLSPDYIWMKPIYMADGRDDGYNIVSHYAIDPALGVKKDFAWLAKTVFKDRILLDIMLDHVSDQSKMFQHDALYTRDRPNCFWRDKPNNWASRVGGPAWTYDQRKGSYYLSLFGPGRADVDFGNPEILEYFRKVVKFWLDEGAAGFRVGNCNVLEKLRLDDSDLVPKEFPKGFERYWQSGSPELLGKIFADVDCFTIGETVCANHFAMRELADSLSCCLNNNVNDAFTGRSGESYHAWFEALVDAAEDENFCFDLTNWGCMLMASELRRVSRELALLTFTLPYDYVCLFQGQELGVGVRFGAEFGFETSASEIFNPGYDQEVDKVSSVWNLHRLLIHLWKNDPVLLYGKLKVNSLKKDGTLAFKRVYGEDYWEVKLDFLHPGSSYMTNGKMTIR